MKKENAEKKRQSKMAVIPCTVTKGDKNYSGMLIGGNLYYKDGFIWWEINLRNKKKKKI